MNKQELIEKYEKLEGVCKDPGAEIARLIFLEDLRELDEPQKVTVPQFVANFITEQKKLGHTLSYSIDACMSDIVAEWYWDNSELFALSWINDYEIEKEKRYLVKAKGVYLNNCLVFEKINKKWFFSSSYEIDHQRGHHTRKELEAGGFCGVFNSPLFEVEEVEE